MNKTKQAKRVFKKTFDQDGFSIELEGGEIVDISDTKWQTIGNKIMTEKEMLFSTTIGYDISFSKEQVQSIDNGL